MGELIQYELSFSLLNNPFFLSLPADRPKLRNPSQPLTTPTLQYLQRRKRFSSQTGKSFNQFLFNISNFSLKMFLVRFNEVREEFVASREGVTMCDYSSFAKFDVWSAGTEAVEFLQKMCSNDIDVPIGHIVHTGMHNKFGGKKSIVNLSSVICNNLLFILLQVTKTTAPSPAWASTDSC